MQVNYPPPPTPPNSISRDLTPADAWAICGGSAEVWEEGGRIVAVQVYRMPD
ncbi:MAG: hypothetical protein JWM47_4118 [Acidimicrobiales bacterium]|nr:hypothetical protein [Acidimicrobiales bacterium]